VIGVDKNLTGPLQQDQTSLVDLGQGTMLKECRLGQYTVLVRIACDGSFVGVEEIRVDSDFLSLEQQMRVPCLDVDKYYKDDDAK
jgi:hypothetical protein